MTAGAVRLLIRIEPDRCFSIEGRFQSFSGLFLHLQIKGVTNASRFAARMFSLNQTGDNDDTL
jgi:hypothetical protein